MGGPCRKIPKNTPPDSRGVVNGRTRQLPQLVSVFISTVYVEERLGKRSKAEQFTAVIANLGRECLEWAPGAANAEIEATISEVSSPEDVIIFTDGSVKRGEKSGWAFTARVNGSNVSEGSGAVDLTTSSMFMEEKALQYLATIQAKKAVIATD